MLNLKQRMNFTQLSLKQTVKVTTTAIGTNSLSRRNSIWASLALITIVSLLTADWSLSSMCPGFAQPDSPLARISAVWNFVTIRHLLQCPTLNNPHTIWLPVFPLRHLTSNLVRRLIVVSVTTHVLNFRSMRCIQDHVIFFKFWGKNANISETVQDQYSYNGRLIGNHTSPIERHLHQWTFVTSENGAR